MCLSRMLFKLILQTLQIQIEREIEEGEKVERDRERKIQHYLENNVH